MSKDLVPTCSGKYVDVYEAANYLRVSVACIRKWLTLKKLQRYRAGRRVLIRIADLDALVAPEVHTESEAA